MTALFRVVCELARNGCLLCRVSTTVAVVLVLIAFGNIGFAQDTPAPITVSYDFRNGARGWEAGFADYPPATDKGGLYELKAEIQALPPELGNNGNGSSLSRVTTAQTICSCF